MPEPDRPPSSVYGWGSASKFAVALAKMVAFHEAR